MKLSYVSLPAMAAVVLSAPHPARQSHGDFVPAPPAEAMLQPISLEEATALMQPDADLAVQESVVIVAAFGESDVSIMSGCRRNVRMRWATMSAEQRTNYVNAIKCLTAAPPKGIWPGAKTLWDEMVWVHGEMGGEIHGTGLFLPWHRYYLHAFATLLSQQCAYNGPLAWWRETNNAGNFAASDIFSPQYFGSLPDAATDRDGGFCLTDGAFADLKFRSEGVPNGESCVARGENKNVTKDVTLANEDLCNAQGQLGISFSGHSGCVEGRNHNILHTGFGPTMENAGISSADPIFYLHHSYVDWQWKRWQNQHSSRWTDITGCADREVQGRPCANPLTRDTVLSSRDLFPEMTVGDVLDTENDNLCYTYDSEI